MHPRKKKNNDTHYEELDYHFQTQMHLEQSNKETHQESSHKTKVISFRIWKNECSWLCFSVLGLLWCINYSKAKSRDSGDSRCRVRVKEGDRPSVMLPEIPILIIGSIKLLRWYTEDWPEWPVGVWAAHLGQTAHLGHVCAWELVDLSVCL